MISKVLGVSGVYGLAGGMIMMIVITKRQQARLFLVPKFFH
jgi:hypothetical protein